MTAADRGRELTPLHKASEFGHLVAAIAGQLNHMNGGAVPPSSKWTFIQTTTTLAVTCDAGYMGPLRAWHKLIEAEWNLRITNNPDHIVARFTRRRRT